MNLPDIQDSRDDRGISIDEVGVVNVRLPFSFSDGIVSQQGIATVAVSVALPSHLRGTHMSRMIQQAETILTDMDPRALSVPMKNLAAALSVDVARFTAVFPLATTVTAPVSGIQSAQVSDVTLSATHDGGSLRLTTAVATDITTLCPCSQAVSDYGAHNQRSCVTVEVHGDEGDPYPFSIADLIELIRGAGSAPVVPVIKRPDERHLTMQAFDRPAFVEDVVRELSEPLRARSVHHRIKSVNIESIHSHDAVASLAWRPTE